MHCPVTGKVCLHKKVVSVTDVSAAGIISREMCYLCGGNLMNEVLPPPVKKPFLKIVGEEFLELVGLKPSLKPACPRCGLTLDEFYKVGKFGCAQCYDHYAEEFEQLAGPFPGDSGEHKGKVPKPNLVGLNPEERLKTLKLKLCSAIEHERFEEAATLSAQIKELESA